MKVFRVSSFNEGVLVGFVTQFDRQQVTTEHFVYVLCVVKNQLVAFILYFKVTKCARTPARKLQTPHSGLNHAFIQSFQGLTHK